MNASILEKIKATKLADLADRKAVRSFETISKQARAADPVRPFADALAKAADPSFALIAEIKKASPSKGLIRDDFDPPALARAYELGGASCLSVLTDAPFFQGDDSFLSAARKACQLPALRKDFLYDPYQVVEARALEADCILIIMASVSDAQAHELEATAFDFGMDALIEVHNEEELERALQLKSRFLGFNNRDLNSFDVSLDVSHRLAKRVPSGYHLVAESGIFTQDDLIELSKSGIYRFLVGESLMRQSNVALATQTLLNGKSADDKIDAF